MGGWAPAVVLETGTDTAAHALAGPCDVNGDGVPDLVAGAPRWEGGDTSTPSPAEVAGSILVFLGKDGGFAPEPIVRTVPGPEVFPDALTCVGEADGRGHGAVVASSRDGDVFAWFGDDDGLSAEPDRHWWQRSTYGRFGIALVAFDVDRDGYDDLLIGDPQSDAIDGQRGLLWKVAGSGAGLAETADLFYEGREVGDHVGIELVPGDFDGDGLRDLIVYQAAVVLPGQPDGFGEPVPLPARMSSYWEWAVGDFDGDGFDDGFAYYISADRLAWVHGSDGGPLDELLLFEDFRVASYALYWSRRNGAAGDVNGDGYDDVFALNFGRDAVDLFAGGPDGLSQSRYTEFLAPSSGERFGVQARRLGDLDGDGFEDFAVTAPASGRIYVYTGRDDGDADGFAWPEDCYDSDAAVFPGAPEVANDGVDQDCDGADLVVEVEDTDPAEDPGGAAEGGACGCGTARPGAGALVAWLVTAALTSRRRRPDQ